MIGVILSEQGRLVTVFGFTQPNGSSISGYVELNIGDDVKYSLGDYYNQDDGKFYQDGVASLATAYNTAALTDGATQASKQAALQSQYTSLKSAFVAAVAALKTKYGV